MTLPSTANGWPLIAMPCPWSFLTMDWTACVPTTANTSPFTGQTPQVLQWPGADKWKVTITSPPLCSDDEARDWTSFIWDAQGGAVAFLLGDPLRRKPRGVDAPNNSQAYTRRSTVDTAMLVNGPIAAMASTINLRGFHANQPRVLQRGDLISVNYRLHQVRDAMVSADINGNAVVTVSPSVREPLIDGMIVSAHDAQGMFRMAKGDIQWSIDQNHFYSVSFACVEAR